MDKVMKCDVVSTLVEQLGNLVANTRIEPLISDEAGNVTEQLIEAGEADKQAIVDKTLSWIATLPEEVRKTIQLPEKVLVKQSDALGLNGLGKSQNSASIIAAKRQAILESAVEFAEYITARWPQIDDGSQSINDIDARDRGTRERPKANYCIAGSLASMLLSQADGFTELSISADSTLAEGRTREIPASAKEVLRTFARLIGDLDFVPTEYYMNQSARLKKGGGGPSFEEVPEKARRALRIEGDQVMLMCDRLETYGGHKIAKITVRGKDYYVVRPDVALAYKVLHLLQSYEDKPARFNADFGKLFRAMKEIFSAEELERATRQVLTAYEEAIKPIRVAVCGTPGNPKVYEKEIPGLIEKVLAHPQTSLAIRGVLEKLDRG